MISFYYPSSKSAQDITDAIISPEQNKTRNGNNTTEDETKDVVSESRKKKQNSNEALQPALNLTSTNGVENKTTEECNNNASVVTVNCAESVKTLNETKDEDTVMKYVSGKNDDVPLKISGHIKNSLKRRKRSLKIQLDNLSSNSAPQILNYDTRHGPRDREEILPVLHPTGNLILNSNLADFNIETLHEPTKPRNENNVEDRENNNRLSNKPPPLREDSHDSRERRPSNNEASDDNRERRPNYNEASDDIREERPNYNEARDDSRERRPDKIEASEDSRESKPNYNEASDDSRERRPNYNEASDDSRERGPYYNEASDDSRERRPDKSEASDESIERNNDESRVRTHDSHKRLPTDSNESLESENLKSTSHNPDSRESQERNESGEEKSDNYKNTEPHGRNINSEEVEVHSPDRESPSRERHFENSKEEERKIYPSGDSRPNFNDKNEQPKEDIKQLTFDDSGRSAPTSIQDVDLGDFSYERILVNKDGKVELDKDTFDKDDNDSREEELVNDKVNNGKDNSHSEYIEKKNNGEIKPVVEINTESNSNEYSDENVETIQPQKAELNKGDTSLETLLGEKETDKVEQSEKVVKNDEQPDSNVKQQFERIPLNYKHDKKTAVNQPESEPKTDITENDKDGTLATLLPKEESYDDKLNFKFHDANIKLPEIKLPDDILSYNYESPYTKNNKKENERFYHYSDEHSDEKPIKEISVPQYDDDRDYYRYEAPYEKKQDYRKRSKHNDDEDDDEDDEHVDLYERFVRERFGKRGSFEKRSAQLRNEVFRPSNPKLMETIQHILKKSEATQKEAEKSGDPKAGYMWTLEYGENL